jgi:hypothetical protein
MTGGPYNYAFVTSEMYVPGTLGGLEGADAKCQGLAQTAHLPGTFKAWLSTSTVDAKSRLESARGWIRPDGRPFADSVAALTQAGQIFYPLRIDESGHDIVDEGLLVYAATGTQRDGTRTTNTSNDWTLSSAAYDYGVPLATARSWTDEFSAPGGQTARLYCFGVDSSRPLAIARAPGRIAFVSDESYVPSGLADADSLCQKEATVASLPGTYRALLATMAAAATARFDLTGPPWVRLDGVPWVAAAADLDQGSVLTALNLGPGGMYGASTVWTGAVFPGIASASAVQNCGDWGSTSQSALVGIAEFSSSLFFDQSGASCGAAGGYLYCLQQ